VLLVAAVLGVAVAVAFAFTLIGLAGEIVAGAALIALAMHGVTRLRHRSPS
jgi:hypothetical protein